MLCPPTEEDDVYWSRGMTCGGVITYRINKLKTQYFLQLWEDTPSANRVHLHEGAGHFLITGRAYCRVRPVRQSKNPVLARFGAPSVMITVIDQTIE
jgi:hypothetical protein